MKLVVQTLCICIACAALNPRQPMSVIATVALLLAVAL